MVLLFPGVRFGLTSRGVFAVGNQSCLEKSGTLVSDIYIQSFILKSVLNEAEVGRCLERSAALLAGFVDSSAAALRAFREMLREGCSFVVFEAIVTFPDRSGFLWQL